MRVSMLDDTDSAELLSSWPRAAARALVAVAVILPAALVLNVLLGRTIHWDIAGAIAALGFVVLTLAFRYAR
jgi:hypothetical protein